MSVLEFPNYLDFHLKPNSPFRILGFIFFSRLVFVGLVSLSVLLLLFFPL